MIGTPRIGCYPRNHHSYHGTWEALGECKRLPWLWEKIAHILSVEQAMLEYRTALHCYT